MVDNTGQLYTIEGIAAGILMIITAYLVISSTSVITPQDVHVVDMQLEQLSYDALAIMDTPDTLNGESMLRTQIEARASGGGNWFGENYSKIINSGATTLNTDNLKFNASIFYVDGPDVKNSNFNGSVYLRENAVTVSRWVTIDPGITHDPQVVRLEVIVWRG